MSTSGPSGPLVFLVSGNLSSADILKQTVWTQIRTDKMSVLIWILTGPRSAVGNVSGYRCVSDCRSRGREFDPGPVPYFRGD